MPSYPYSYVYYTSPLYSVVLPVLAAIVALAGGLALYFLFVRRPNRYHGAAARLHDALTFRTFYTERLLRALYCITVVALTVYSFILLFSHFFLALLCFAGGNLIARIVYEYALLLLVLCRNAQEINRKMGPLPEEPAAPSAPPAMCRPGSRKHPSSLRVLRRRRFRRPRPSSRLCRRSSPSRAACRRTSRRSNKSRRPASCGAVFFAQARVIKVSVWLSDRLCS